MPPDYGTFAPLNAAKRDLYRAVLRVFAAAKSRFILHLRPSEVAAELATPGSAGGNALSPPDEIEAALRQLGEEA